MSGVWLPLAGLLFWTALVSALPSGRKRPGLPARILIVVGIVTAVLAVVFAATHGMWFDRLDHEHRVSFWIEAMVAYGTLALAIVTWASVRESQEIIAAEDLRFLASRMPMVKVAETRRQLGGVFLKLRNDGEGPALNVRCSFAAKTRLTWTANGSPDPAAHDKSDESEVSRTDEPVSPYMPVGPAGEWRRLFDAYEPGRANAKPLAYVDEMKGASAAVTFSSLEIHYDDAFGYHYVTRHEPNVGGEIVPDRFSWDAPLDLRQRFS